MAVSAIAVSATYIHVLLSISVVWITLEKGRAKMLAALPQTDVTIEQKRNLRDPSRFLVIAYSQDEAFQALSLLTNMLSIIHQLLFICILAVSRLSSRTKVFNILVGVPWAIIMAGVMLFAATIPMGIILASMANVWPSLRPSIAAAGHLVNGVIINNYLWPLLDFSVNFLLIFIVIVGSIILTSIASILITGIFRVCVFSVIGVMEQIRNQNNFLNCVLGTVSISMIPEGPSQSILLDGRTLFNHVNIYDDEQTIGKIAEFIEDTLAARASQKPQ